MVVRPDSRASSWQLYLEPSGPAGNGSVYRVEAVLNDGSVLEWYTVVNAAASQ